MNMTALLVLAWVVVSIVTVAGLPPQSLVPMLLLVFILVVVPIDLAVKVARYFYRQWRVR